MLDDRPRVVQALAEADALLARLEALDHQWKLQDAWGTIAYYHRKVFGQDPGDPDRRTTRRMLHYLMAEHGVSCSDFTPDGDFLIELAEKLRGLLAPEIAIGAAESEQPDTPIEKPSGSTPGPTVRLGSSHMDVAWVRGKPKTGLTPAQFDVVKALLEAGRRGLTGELLAEKSRHRDAVNILRRVQKLDADWKAVILFPGTGGRCYRIAWTADP